MKLIKDWDTLGCCEKIFRVISLVLSVFVIVTALLGILQILEPTLFGVNMMPIMLVLSALNCFCQAVYAWRTMRSTAIMSLCVGVFIVVCVVVIKVQEIMLGIS